jgi:hypothetical protein
MWSTPAVDRRAQHPQCLVAVARRPEDPVAGELHRAVPGPVHPPRAEREGPAEIDRRDLVAALDRAAEKQVTIISAPAGSGKTSLLRAWADRPGQGPPYRLPVRTAGPARRAAVLARPAGRGPAAAGTEGPRSRRP